MTEGETRKLLGRVMKAARRGGAEVIAGVRTARGGNTRFAVNEITSSGEIETVTLSVTVQVGKRAAIANTNQLDDASIEDVIARAQRMARLAPENPEAMPPLPAQRYIAVPKASDAGTEAAGPALRAKAAGAAIAAARAANVTIAGFYEHGVHTRALATTAGLTAFHAWTTAGLSCTARTQDGTGSGWAGADSNEVSDLDAAAMAKIAVGKAASSAKPRRLEAGRYTVVLEPAAVAGLLGSLIGSLGARRADEGRSFFSKGGGKTKVGDRLFPAHVTLRSDPADAALAAAPFDVEGFPQKRVTWIDQGTVAGLTYSRYWAQREGKQPTGNPDGWILDGGTQTREQLIAGVKRGVLITRFWYIRMLDPQTILLTGLTRDGTFLIENGQIAGPVNNFRFNESPVQMLANSDALSAGALVEGMRVPALRTHEFNLASISEAV